MDKKTKIVKIEGAHYYFPEGITDIDEFVNFLNNNNNKFIKMTKLNEDNCVSPYFKAEETTKVYLTTSYCTYLEEIEATILTKEEYNERLRQLVKTKCVSCEYYVDDDNADDPLDGHYDTLCLDGHCWRYSKKKNNP